MVYFTQDVGRNRILADDRRLPAPARPEVAA